VGFRPAENKKWQDHAQNPEEIAKMRAILAIPAPLLIRQ